MAVMRTEVKSEGAEMCETPAHDGAAACRGGQACLTGATRQRPRSKAPDFYCRLIVETMTEGALVLSFQGVILYCNCGFSRMVGAPAEKLVGIPFTRLAAEEDRQLFQDLLEKSARGQTCAEVIRLSGSGTAHAVRLSAGVRIVESDSDAALFCVVVDDAAARIQTEDALRQTKDRLERTAEMLRESQAKYLDLYEHADDIVFALDSLGRFTSANRSFYAELGIEEDVVGKHFLEIFASESARTALQIMEKLLVNEPHAREKQPWEFEMAAADGSIVNFELRARLIRGRETIVGLQCIARNITGHKQVEMELNRLATAIEQAAESVIILDRNGKIQYANKAFFRISGYSREEVLGRTTAFLKSDKRGRRDFLPRNGEHRQRKERLDRPHLEQKEGRLDLRGGNDNLAG